ncbi:hypothetical protein ES703_117702 [subsurface metagenome]
MKPAPSIGYFDLETQFLFSDIDSNWNEMTWTEKQSTRGRLTKQLKIAIAGLSMNNMNNEDVVFFEEYEVDLLKSYLLSLDIVVGHNLIAFDYVVLRRYFSKDIIEKLKNKTIDTFQCIREKTGDWTKLDDLGKMNLGLEKLEDSIEIPGLWRAGKHQRVKEHLERDILIVKKIYNLGKETGELKYIHKDYGKIIGEDVVHIDW